MRLTTSSSSSSSSSSHPRIESTQGTSQGFMGALWAPCMPSLADEQLLTPLLRKGRVSIHVNATPPSMSQKEARAARIHDNECRSSGSPGLSWGNRKKAQQDAHLGFGPSWSKLMAPSQLAASCSSLSPLTEAFKMASNTGLCWAADRKFAIFCKRAA